MDISNLYDVYLFKDAPDQALIALPLKRLYESAEVGSLPDGAHTLRIETSLKNDEDAEKKKIYDQIKKDIEKMPLKEFRLYIDDNPIIRSDYPYSSVFALESAINKWGDKLGAVPYYYGRLATEYSMISRWENSKMMFIKQYKSLYKSPSDTKQLINFNNDALVYALREILSSMTPGCEKYTYSEAQLFLEKNPDATSEQIKEVKRIIGVYTNIEAEEKKTKIVKKLAQAFLDDLAGYYNRKDKEGLRKFFIANMEDKERAEFYAERGWEFFLVTDEIHFPIINISGLNNEYRVVYGWDMKPKDIIKRNPNAVGHPSLTFKYEKDHLILLH